MLCSIRRIRKRFTRFFTRGTHAMVVHLAGSAATGGNDVGGIFKSANGGATWKKLTNGLPPQTGRIGLAISASKPKVVMAVVQSEAGGANDIRTIHSRARRRFPIGRWRRKMDAYERHCPRPFYFSQIRIDPVNDQRVYVFGMAVLVSDEGGKKFREDLSEKVHPDCHAFAIQPNSAPAPKPP